MTGNAISTRNLKTNIFSRDRFSYDVLCHTDLSRTSGESFGTPLNRINWGNYDLVVIDESHNFRNNEAFKERETRYQKLMNQVIQSMILAKEEKDIESLFSGGKTTALVDTIAGLDDFELLAFLVVQGST